ncbi:energy transducer TonB [Hyphobacterium sp. HN65]|uniref:Protein TonB n=1 Tax=Hyphobacterium lacteum TaxID=3116575 RepID=A0ABU7LTC1_9PROT|nr:energy transducer TonB [Hyphobacterium sp. HN65]MEE2527153.1 energy transducer TonB [Hyphobacterium sp. HN65]
MRYLVGLLAIICLTSSASAQDIPASVMEAYEGYTRAAESNDLEAGLSYAYTAWQEGENAEIDRATLSVLASNYAELAGLSGRHREAAEAYQRAVDLHLEAGGAEAETATFRTEIARSFLRANQFRSARLQADENIEFFETHFDGEQRDLGLYFNRVVAALAAFSASSEAAAVRYAEPAIEYVERNNGVQNEDIAYLAFILARSSYDLRRWEDAAYYGAIAYVIGRNVMPDAELVASSTGIIGGAGRRGEQEGRLDELQARVLASNFRPTECASDDETCPATIAAELAAGETYIPSIPMFRIPPVYPSRAAQLGREGYVDVVFSVDERGRTFNVEVVESSSTLFENAALDSVERWRYWPAIRNGEPVQRHGVHTRIEFEFAY